VAAQKAEAETLLQLRKGDSDSLQLVLEAVQRVIQLEGDPGAPTCQHMRACYLNSPRLPPAAYSTECPF